jgi:LysM repeat protein
MIKAVDVYNGTRRNGLDFARVKAAGYDLAIVKATEGVNYVDPSFSANVGDARAAGMLVGAYHFMRATPIEQQAQDFLAVIKDHGPYAMLAIDVENPSPKSTEISSLGKEGIMSRIITLYKAIRDAGYTCPVYVYASASWLRTLIDTDSLRTSGMLIWGAAYSTDTPNNTDHSAEWDMWQWCSDGHVDGITGNVDCDVIYRGIDDVTSEPAKPETSSAKPATPAGATYTVKPGDTLSAIAAKFGTTYQELAKLNGIANPNKIYPGQVLKLTRSASTGNSAPKSAVAATYTVKAGDTLSAIAAKYGTTYQELAKINGIADPNKIYPGQVLKLNGSAASPKAPSITYTVKAGDTLSGIAMKFGTTYQRIAQINGIKDPNKIYPGQVLKIK